jgi:hypothetical protein
MSKLEDELFLQIKLSELPVPVREYRFHKKRRWKSDFAWPDFNFICEVEGGIFVNGRHSRGLGFMNDCEKYNEALILGWKVLRVCSKHIKSGEAINWIERSLK